MIMLFVGVERFLSFLAMSACHAFYQFKRLVNVRENRKDIILTSLSVFSFKIKDLERDFDAEVRRSNEFQKAAKKSDRRLKEIAFQGDEDAKNIQRLQEQTDRLNNKIKKMRVQLDEAVIFLIFLL